MLECTIDHYFKVRTEYTTPKLLRKQSLLLDIYLSGRVSSFGEENEKKKDFGLDGTILKALSNQIKPDLGEVSDRRLTFKAEPETQSTASPSKVFNPLKSVHFFPNTVQINLTIGIWEKFNL